MKGILIFNQLNDIIYLHYDEGFRRHVNRQAMAVGMLQDTEGPVDPNIAMQLFSPLLASQRFMIGQTENPYHTIRCANNFVFAFEQYHDQVLLAVNGDDSEKAEFMHRKLLVLQRIVRFLFGPCDEEIRREKVHERDARWRYVSRLLDMWLELYNDEQSFLVEAIERLHVNQLLNGKCVQLLERALTAMRSAGDKGAIHALLVVNSKLLSLFSMRNAFELLPPDILIIILLAKTNFPTIQKLEDFFSQSVAVSTSSNPVCVRDREQYESASEGNEDSEDVEYFSSAPSTPQNDSPLNDAFSTAEPTDTPSLDGFHSPPADSIPDQLVSKLEAHASTSGARGEDREKLEQTYWPPTQEMEEREAYQKFTAMLGTSTCKYTPHTLHCMEIMPGIIFIIVSEVARGKQAGMICQTVSVIRALLHQAKTTSANGRYTMDFIDTNIKKLMDMTRKIKGSNQLTRVSREITSKWDIIKRTGLVAYLDNHQPANLPSRLEGPLSTLHDRLKDLFKVLFLIQRNQPEDIHQSILTGIDKVQRLLRHHLYDCKDYLAVKAQRNITITNFVESFPGLVHFLYIDRTTHQMTSPSINIISQPETGKVDMMAIIKKKLWEMIPKMQDHLHAGYTTQILREGDFLYSYFLWYEDVTGAPVIMPQPYIGMQRNILPGVLTGSFYRHVLQQVFPGPVQHAMHGYELIMVHVGIVPTHYILRHGRKLAALMWEMTGEVNSPINLL